MMKMFLPLMMILALCSTGRAADNAEADALWNKLEEAIGNLKKPKERPKSREEAGEMVKQLIPAFDEAEKAFLETAPNDARRWKARLAEVEFIRAREFAGLPAKGDLKATVAEILAAADASDEVKGDASVMQVFSAAEKADEQGGMDEFKKLAEAHIKKFPQHKANSFMEAKLKSLQAQADIKTKPLDLKFTSVDGHEVDLANMRGKVVLIDFWATWCGPCVQELPNVLKAYEKLHPKGFEIVGISLDQDKGALEKFVKEKNMTWPQFFDGKGWKNEISTKYGISSIPAMWLVDKKGMVVSTNARGKLEELVEKHLAE